MIKKVIMTVSGIMLGVVIAGFSCKDVMAALPSTYDKISDANWHIAHSDEMYAKAKAYEAEALAVLNAVKADPAHSQLQYEQAVFNYNNAVNLSKWWASMVANSNAYLKNINGLAAFEDKFAANRAALADLTKLGAAKTEAEGAASVANGVLAQIKDVEKAIAGYKVMAAGNPSLQAQIDELNVKLAALNADYAAKAAVASEKANIYNTYLKTLNYQGYSVGFENYQFDREWERDNEDWDPKGYY